MLDVEVPLAGEREDAWVLQVRRDVRRLLRRARICWSSACVELGAADTAVQVASAALGEDPFDEQACRTVMTAHRLAGRSGAALVAYRELQVAMSEQLGSDPSAATQALFLSILRAESPAAPGRPVRGGPAAEAAASGTPILGRDRELATLGRLWAGAAVGSAVLAVVTGEAGIGKSALVSTFVAEPRRTGAMVVTVGCFEAERSLYLQPLLEVVRVVEQRIDAAEIRELAGLLPELAQLGGPVAGAAAPGGGPELEHRRSLEALVEFFDRLSDRQPVLLVIEDAQHAGQSSIEALHLLAGRWAGSRVMVVVTERSSEDDLVTAALLDVAVHLELVR